MQLSRANLLAGDTVFLFGFRWGLCPVGVPDLSGLRPSVAYQWDRLKAGLQQNRPNKNTVWQGNCLALLRFN
jgi:hypothetical protein